MRNISIILPVRNGGEYVKTCLDSIFQQTNKNWKLHILDNCSTDGSSEWLKTLQSERVEYLPSMESLNIEGNWSRIVQVKKLEFCTLIGHDDVLHPRYLEEMFSLIDQYPKAGLYTSNFSYIDSLGTPIRPCKPLKQQYSPSEFLSDFLENRLDSMGTGFTMRSEDYDRVGGIPTKYPSLLFADFDLWINLTRGSSLVTSPKNLFSFRIHQSTTTTSNDEVLIKAFFIFLNFLKELSLKDETLTSVIRDHSLAFIEHSCRALSHRMLRTPKDSRRNITVQALANQCRGYVKDIAAINNWDPYSIPGMKVAQIIDNSSLLRNLFLLFKRVYAAPFYK